MDNELKEKIADILKNCTTFTNESYDYADQILSLIAPVVEKAEKWDRVKSLSKSDNCSGCIYDHENDCVLDGMCCFSAVADAIEKESEIKSSFSVRSVDGEKERGING